MMWHFYEIPYIPDLELVKYQSLGEQGIDGILERHNRFLRQWQRNTVLIHTTLHFFLLLNIPLQFVIGCLQL